ncbi:hypothetical protein CVT25_014922 [Psilocybe cyanescens]|uniref:Uncharacterized protein n=1 Tax=Psilocybe cyanescens TaxID=93625 RepID=A0A409XI22_PSICY|nr:hypothetical protein CVT25_014922 [Psilocybe cyanescens]
MAASIEQQKQQYSKQLAAYTLRQWNAVRHDSGSQRRDKHQSATSEVRRDKKDNQSSSTDEGEHNGQTTQTGRQKSNGQKGVHVVDFGTRRSPKRPA